MGMAGFAFRSSFGPFRPTAAKGDAGESMGEEPSNVYERPNGR